MRVKNKYGFINERGSYNFDFNDENESKTFMVSCIVVNENQLEQLNTESSFIVKDFLKADNLIDEDLKWTMKKVALKDLSHLDIEIFIFLVKKERLKEEYGIKDKESFLEFLNGILYTDIIAAYPHIKLISNELIEKEFLKEFDKYLIEKHSPDLLGEYDVVFVDEEKEYSFLVPPLLLIKSKAILMELYAISSSNSSLIYFCKFSIYSSGVLGQEANGKTFSLIIS